MLTDLLNRPCTIVRRTAGDADELGNATQTTAEVETVCELQQRARPERTDAGTVATSEWALYLLPDAEIDTGDAVVIDGATYEVAGTPKRLRNPRTQQIEHVEATLTLTTGAAG